jgi:ketosteroid isomerase-like protein
MDWVIEWGRYDAKRWRDDWQNLFDTHELVHNIRTIRKIEVSKEGDGAFAVVDIDTNWRSTSGEENRWMGRTCKIYSKVDNEWKMTAQVGVLDYDDVMI